MDKKEMVQPPSLYEAASYGYSHGIKLGSTVYVSGQVSTAETLEAQAEEDFAGIEAVLTEAGGSMDDIVKLNMFTTERDCWERTANVREKYLKPPYPAATMVVVAGLAQPAFKLEVEAVAVIGSGG